MKTSEFTKLVIWEMVNPLLLKVKKKKIYKFNPVFKGLNLGCGLDNPLDWLGIDGGITHIFVKRFPKFISRGFFRKFNMSKNYSFSDYYSKLKTMRIIHHNLVYGVPFKDHSVPHIFSSHFLEHLTKEEGEFLIAESYRVLRPGGIIRVCVPSLDKAVQAIREAVDDYDSGDSERIQKFVTSVKSGYSGNYSHHRRMYNFKELAAVLAKVGFKEIKEMEFKKGNIPDVEALDTRPGLFVEAVK